MDMESTIRKNLMQYAASRQMFCPACGDILDCENNLVYWHGLHPEHKQREAAKAINSILCTKCFDKVERKGLPADYHWEIDDCRSRHTRIIPPHAIDTEDATQSTLGL